MAKVAPVILEALARVGYSEKQLMDWLDERLVEYKDRIMFQTDEVQMRILQGRAQELAELRGLIKTAPELLRKA